MPPTLAPKHTVCLSHSEILQNQEKIQISHVVLPCRAEHEGKPLRFFSTNNTLKTYYGPLLLRPVSFLRHAAGGTCRALVNYMLGVTRAQG